MIRDAAAVGRNEIIEAEVAIVGAGPAGITMARELAANGVHVTLLDSGGLHHDEVGERDLTDGKSVGLPYYPLPETRARAFGGSSHRWFPHQGWRARPLDPSDFEPHPSIPLSGWPISFDELSEYYERARSVVGLAGRHENWGDEPTAPPLDGPFRTAGLPFAAPDCFTSRYEELASSDNVTVVLHATVTGIRRSKGDRVEAFEAVTDGGDRFEVRAESFVLALGGIENARTLLANSIGNEYDQVGRYFMEHPTVRVGVIRTKNATQCSELGRYKQQAPNPPPGMDLRILISEDLRRSERLLGTAFTLSPGCAIRSTRGVRAIAEVRRRRRLSPRQNRPDGRLLIDALSDSGNVSRYVGRRFRQVDHQDDALEIWAVGEQVPNPSSRVALGQEQDRFGVPRAQLRWRLTDLDQSSLRCSSEILAEAIRNAGSDVELFTRDDYVFSKPVGHYHHMGTTRMSVEPSGGVVDPDCRLHDTENLFAVGASVFPTGGWANPTLTLVALAIRLARHLTVIRSAQATRS